MSIVRNLETGANANVLDCKMALKPQEWDMKLNET